MGKEDLINEIDSIFEQIMSVADSMENLSKKHSYNIITIIELAEKGVILTNELNNIM